MFQRPVTSKLKLWDTFDRANSTSTLGSADTGQAWTARSGTWGVSSNRGYLVTTSPEASYIATVDPGLTNLIASGTVTFGSTRVNSGLLLKYIDTSNHIIVNFYRPNSADPPDFTIQVCNSGTYTVRRAFYSPSFYTLGATHAFRVLVRGDYILAECQGRPIQYTLTGTESTKFAAQTPIGFRSFRGTNVYADDGGFRIDDLAVEAI